MERLNKFLAHAGVASRRQCDALIAAGRVRINDVVVTNLGTKVDPGNHKVYVDDALVKTESLVYWVVHKPPGYLCTNDDPGGRPKALDLIPHVSQRVYTVGRLDEASEGLLLMTNDGDLANALMHPRFEIEKTYLVWWPGPRPKTQHRNCSMGCGRGKVKAKSVKRLKGQGDSTWLQIVLSEGKNREIRRMLAKLDHKVMKLKRIAIGSVELDKLPRGKCRKLSVNELAHLRRLVERSQKKIDEVRSRVANDRGGEDF
ncbi:MAG: pseudouridine synthase [Gemmataceae bacterium]